MKDEHGWVQVMEAVCQPQPGECELLRARVAGLETERDEALAECTELATHRDAALALLRRVFDDLGDWGVSRHPADHWYDGDPRPTRLGNDDQQGEVT